MDSLPPQGTHHVSSSYQCILYLLQQCVRYTPAITRTKGRYTYLPGQCQGSSPAADPRSYLSCCSCLHCCLHWQLLRWLMSVPAGNTDADVVQLTSKLSSCQPVPLNTLHVAHCHRLGFLWTQAVLTALALWQVSRAVSAEPRSLWFCAHRSAPPSRASQPSPGRPTCTAR